MKLTTAIFLPLAALAAATPATINTAKFEEVSLIPADNSTTTAAPALAGTKRNTGWAGIYYCRNANWGAPCAHTWVKINSCMNFPKGWDNNIRSFGPDRGAHYCVLHSAPGCGGGEPKFRVRYPGTRNTMEFGQHNQASSVRCNY